MTLIPGETEVFGISVPLRQYTEKERVYIGVCGGYVIAMVSLYVGICIGSKGFTGSWMHMIPLVLLFGWCTSVEPRLYRKDIKYNNTSAISWYISGTLLVIFFVWFVYGAWQKIDSIYYLFFALGLGLLTNKADVAKIMAELVPPYQWRYTDAKILEEITCRTEDAKRERVGVLFRAYRGISEGDEEYLKLKSIWGNHPAGIADAEYIELYGIVHTPSVRDAYPGLLPIYVGYGYRV